MPWSSSSTLKLRIEGILLFKNVALARATSRLSARVLQFPATMTFTSFRLLYSATSIPLSLDCEASRKDHPTAFCGCSPALTECENVVPHEQRNTKIVSFAACAEGAKKLPFRSARRSLTCCGVWPHLGQAGICEG